MYVVQDGDNRGATFHIGNAPVDLTLPDITFNGLLGSSVVLENNATIQTDVNISGTGDCRAYDEAKGNADHVTISVSVPSGSSVSKSVSSEYVELNGQFTYTVQYENKSSVALKTVYFNDLLPAPNDNRGSQYSGSVGLGEFSLDAGQETQNGTSLTLYYSTMEYEALREEVNGFKYTNADDVEKMLADSSKFNVLGTIEAGGDLKPDKDLPTDDAALKQLMTKITGLYVKVNNLGAGQTLKLRFSVGTADNKASESYRNRAYGWSPDSGGILESNLVETTVVSRSISGVVWYDKNANGVRDSGEPLLSDVICDLFKKNASGDYKKVTQDVTRAPLQSQTTNENGAYSFDKLPEGEYVVAFKGGELSNYTGATTYQVNGENDDNTNDGVKATDLSSSLSGYNYAIKYSDAAQTVKLHSIKDLAKGDVTGAFQNSTELVANQDLGLVKKGDLSISKTVEGADADQGKDFTFTITAMLGEEPVTGQYSLTKETKNDALGAIASAFSGILEFFGAAPASEPETVTFDDKGEATITLKDGETATISGLPVGAVCTVTEASATGYTPWYSVGGGSYTGGSAADNLTIVKDGITAVSFKNTYDPTEATFTPKVNKSFTSESAERPDEATFKFQVTEAKDNSNLENGATIANNGVTEVTVSKDEGAATSPKEAALSRITFSKAGEYNFTITEQAKTGNENPGYTYDTASWNLYVEVENNPATGVLSVKENSVKYTKNEANPAVESSTAASFVNSYQPEPTNYTPQVKKKIDGNVPTGEAKTFTFNLTAADNNPAGATLPAGNGTTATVTGEGANSFGSIEFTKEGTYYFNITEQPKTGAENPGYTYDTNTTRVLRVDVTDKGGQLSAEASYVEAVGSSEAINDGAATLEGGILAALFTNTYTPDTITSTPSVTKSFTDNGQDRPGDAKTFSFKLTPDSSNPTDGAVYQDGTVLNDQTVDTTTVNGANMSSFRTITYKKAGTYTFEITEDDTNPYGGYDYDDSEWTYTVVVKDTGGKLEIDETPTYSKNGTQESNTTGASFVNTYQPTPTTYTPQVTKTLTGTNAKQPFSFLLTAAENVDTDSLGYMKPVEGAEPTKEAWPDGGLVASINGAGAAQFHGIVFEKAGTYTFSITENDPRADGYRYDTSTWTLTVKVKDDNGELKIDGTPTYTKGSATGNETTGAAFTNTYTANGSLTLNGVKKMDGRDFQSGDKFTFELKGTTAGDGNVPMPAGSQDGTLTKTIEPSSDTSADVEFGKIDFTEANVGKTYTYTITEKSSGLGGVTDDTVAKVLTVYVADKGDGTLTLKKDNADGAAITDADIKPVFTWTNKYGTSGELKLSATKTITGRNFQKGDEFTFTLEPQGDAPAAEQSEVTIKPESGTTATIDFGKITFDSKTAGNTYTYKVKETRGNAGGMTYDEVEKTVTVEVTDPNHDGHLKFKVDYGVDAEGNELSGVTFANTYEAHGSLELTGSKTLAGRDFQDSDKFMFELRALTEGAPMPEDSADGVKQVEAAVKAGSDPASVDFGTINYTQDTLGTYTYQMRELSTDAGGISCSADVKTVVVNVSDNGDGTLNVAASTTDTDGNGTTSEGSGNTAAVLGGKTLTWENTYSARGSFDLAGTKAVEGRSFLDGEALTFTVQGKGDAPKPANLTNVTTDESGLWTGELTVVPEAGASEAAVDFGAIAFDTDLMNAGGTYQSERTFAYLIAEKQGTAGGMTYDAAPRTVTLTVTDDGEGSLNVAADYGTTDEGEPAASLAWANRYDASGSLTLAAAKAIEGRNFQAGDTFAFTIEGSEGAPMPASNRVVITPEDGNLAAVDFGAIEFGLADVGQTYTYTLREEAGSADNMTYDASPRTATVTVLDPDNNGELAFRVDYGTAADGAALAAATFTNVYTPPTPSEPGNPSSPEEPITPTALSQTGDGIPGAVMIVCGVIAAALVVAAASLLRIRRNAKKGAHTR